MWKKQRDLVSLSGYPKIHDYFLIARSVYFFSLSIIVVGFSQRSQFDKICFCSNICKYFPSQGPECWRQVMKGCGGSSSREGEKERT